MFVDEIEVTFIAGKGGDGKASFFPGYKSGPNGGNGGDGGNVYITVTSDLTLLDQFSGKKVRKAESGVDGRENRKDGSDGNDITIQLPLGSILTDKNNGEVMELNRLDQKMLVCIGGKGGMGTYDMRSPSNTTPLAGEKGTPGQKREFQIVLKLIAHFGLIGLPNAGKSSLLNALTNASAKVANYPFTTLEPNLGVMGRKIIADLPGLIEGASEGKGLGIKFLKHIEKVSLLIHCISAESVDPLKDYETVRTELKKFNPALLEKPEIILLTKSDVLSSEAVKTQLALFKSKKEVMSMSVLDETQLDKLRAQIF